MLYRQKHGKLKQYSSISPTTEIDSTSYRFPEQGMVLSWARQTPSNFTLVLDAVRGVETDLDQFLETMKPLTEAGKLACILVQFPPFLRFNKEHFESFLSILPGTARFAVEFRLDSWLNPTLKMLEKYRVAYTIVDDPCYRQTSTSRQTSPTYVGMDGASRRGSITSTQKSNSPASAADSTCAHLHKDITRTNRGNRSILNLDPVWSRRKCCFHQDSPYSAWSQIISCLWSGSDISSNLNLWVLSRAEHSPRAKRLYPTSPTRGVPRTMRSNP